ncbi:hypothetical protein [Pseudomonas botevensis]|uniref:hypothetical protein n=1 Tax=Pseudomonas botevensis TaxID=2842352 RepID=UPI001C3C65CA|nr:hypothetical protein [Pseudomonas botevensis]MBV4477690.1 hypothetical protein [Pseudomonas botevensis]
MQAAEALAWGHAIYLMAWLLSAQIQADTKKFSARRVFLFFGLSGDEAHRTHAITMDAGSTGGRQWI